MPLLTVKMFGTIRVEYQDRFLPMQSNCKVRELFCYLLAHRNSFHSREMLAAKLWEDSTAAQSKRNLRQSLWRLQSLYSDFIEGVKERLIETHVDKVRLNPAVDLWIDVIIFADAFAICRAERDLTETGRQALHNAVQLYHGEFLEGWYQDWCILERERFQNMCLEMLDRLACHCLKTGEYKMGLQYAEQTLRYNPESERAYQQLMQMHYLAGDRTEALRQFDRCVKALRDELGIEPARKTLLLRDQICADRDEVKNGAAPGEVSLGKLASLPGVLAHLKQFQSTLAEMQRQIQADIQTVEQLMPIQSDNFQGRGFVNADADAKPDPRFDPLRAPSDRRDR